MMSKVRRLFCNTARTAAVMLFILVFMAGSIPASAAEEVPAPPSELTAEPLETGQVQLSWVDNSGDEASFHLERAADSAFIQFSVTFNVPAGVTEFTDNTIDPATTYYYRVLAVNEGGKSEPSNTVTVTTADALAFPESPTDLSGRTVSLDQITLTWKDRSGNEEGFRVERAEDALFTQGAASFDLPADTVTFTDTSRLGPLGIYYYRVIAFNSSGDSVPSNLLKIQAWDWPPEIPSQMYAISQDYRQVMLRWVDNSNNETGFIIERAADADFRRHLVRFTAKANIDSGSPLVTVEDRQAPPGPWYFRVRAVNDSGESDPSDFVMVVVKDKYHEKTVPRRYTVDLAYPGFGRIFDRLGVNRFGELVDIDDEVISGSQTFNMTDYSGSLIIPGKTRMQNVYENPLTELIYNGVEVRPEPPEGKVMVRGYHFGPWGASFDKEITLVLKYTPEDLPERAVPQSLCLYTWNGYVWQPQAVTKLDIAQRSLTCKVKQLTDVAILCNEPDLEPRFTVSRLNIANPRPLEGEAVKITVTATNGGYGPGFYDVVLKIDGEVEDSREVELEPGKSTEVTFICAPRAAGNYKVDINGVRGSFNVEPKPVEPSPTLTEIPVPPVETGSPIPDYTPTAPRGTVIFWIIGGAVLAVIILLVFMIRR